MLGYKGFGFSILETAGPKYVYCDNGIYSAKALGCDFSYAIDCGYNEELFLAIAALRDDSDKDQYFTDGTCWFKCPYERVEECRKNAGNYENKLIDYSTKATVKELIEYFKKIKL